MSNYSNVPASPSPVAVQERIYRGDELSPGNAYTLISTRQTKKLKPGVQFLATVLVEGESRAVVSLDTGSVLYATDNDIFSRWE